MSTLDFIPINGSGEPKPQNQEPVEGQPEEPQGEFIVKIAFLSIKSSWEFYCLKHASKPEGEVEEKDLEIEGCKIRRLFNEGVVALKNPAQKY